MFGYTDGTSCDSQITKTVVKKKKKKKKKHLKKLNSNIYFQENVLVAQHNNADLAQT